MAGIPGVAKQSWWQQKSIAELASVVGPIFLTIATIVTDWIIDETSTIKLTKSQYIAKFSCLVMLVFAIFWQIFAAVIKVKQAHSSDEERSSNADHAGIVGALHVIYNLVNVKAKGAKLTPGQLRITVHRVVWPERSGESAEVLEQIVPYIGGPGGPKGRQNSIRSGIIGKVVRENQAHAAKRTNPDYDLYIKELVSQWSYTESDARKLKKDRMSWMAVPIASPTDQVIAVVYLDSDQPGMFTVEVQQFVVSCCGGVAAYLEERYR